MPHATWKGFLRLSLVSCPVFLLPASTRTKSVRLHQVWVPHSEPRADLDFEETPDERTLSRSSGGLPRGQGLESIAEPEEPGDVGPAARIALRPVDRDTGEAIEREEVVNGFEYERGQFVTFTPQELKARDVETRRRSTWPDRRQRSLLLPVAGTGDRAAAADITGPPRRKKA
jgi:hypothetical protein